MIVNHINLSVDELTARLTQVSHNTIIHLYNQGHISKEECEELLGKVIVVAIPNNSLLGKVRDFFFGKDTKEDKSVYQYHVTQILS